MTKLEAGQCVNGYLLIRSIHEGLSGVLIFESLCFKSHQTFALKFIPTFKSTLFFRELEIVNIAANCGVNVVKLFENFEIDGYNVVVMELYKGDLLNFITSYPECNIEIKKDIFRDICLVVKGLHNCEISHLDIKPENIFLDNNNNIVLGDFEFAVRECTRTLYVGRPVGTTVYSSPEVAQVKQFDPKKADIWSLGITLHVLLFGAWPYSFENEQELLQCVCNGAVLYSPTLTAPDSEIFKLMHQMLHPVPEFRPTIGDILESDWLLQKNNPIAKRLRNDKVENK